MGHLSGKGHYLALQQRLEKNPLGPPEHEAFFGILHELFTEEECRVAAAMPLQLAPARVIAARAGMDETRVAAILAGLAPKGLVVDFPHPRGDVYYYLNPPLIGFFEFTMMRVRPEVDQKKVSELLYEYLHEDPQRLYAYELLKGETYLAKPLVHEDALTPEVYSEVLDYEKATHYIESAGDWAVSLCHCRHVKEHLGEPCHDPMEICLSLGMGAKYLVRNGIARRIEKAEAMDVLVRAREMDTVQMGDNVQRRPTFICNCCKCCCEMMAGLRMFPTEAQVITSNYVAAIDENGCTGCGKCVAKCPVDAIELVDATPTERAPKRKKRAVVHAANCLGCGVCHRQCRFDALRLQPIGERVHTPVSTMEKLMLQAIEHGKLQHLLFDHQGKITHRALNTFFGALLNLPPAKQLLAREQLKSRFVRFLLDGFSRTKKGWMAKV